MSIADKIKRYYLPKRKPKKTPEPIPISRSVNENASAIRELFSGAGDIVLKTTKLNFCGRKYAVLVAFADGIADKELITICVMNPIAAYSGQACEKDDVFTVLSHEVVASADIKTVAQLRQASRLMMSGFALVFVHGSDKALAVGVQGYAFRSIDEPQTEVLQRGSREGFSEPLKINQALLRRRVKSEKLRFEPMSIGMTDISLCYLRDTASDELIRELRSCLQQADLEAVFSAGCLSQYLDNGDFSLFNGVGVTERPDVACAKLCEGKAAVLIDGTPTVLIVPHIMAESFSTLDDYSDRPYFAAMTRWLKYTAFLISVILPGLYVALCTYSPEFFPNQLLTRVATSISKTPFSAFAEVLLFTFIYEIMREAGLRLPKTLGHAVSIIGGLVIGDTAVSSGFIGAPTLMIVALTVICSYVIPDLYAPVSALRFLFIIFGGVWGLWGIMIMLCLTVTDLCSKRSFGVPYMIPLAPLDMFGMRDAAVRAPMSVLSRRKYILRREDSCDGTNR